MPRVDADLKLDFKDVLVRPKRSSLKSRAEVDLTRTFTFRNSKQTYTGIPIIVANMDTVGTFEMAVVMAKHAMFTAIHKHYSLEEWKLFAANHPECLEHVAASSGSGQDDLKKLTSILEAIPAIKYICLDVANGYSEYFVEFVKSVRALFPHHTIMAGNVVTGEMVEELIISGADIIKVGIGPGSVCTTRIKTGVGYPQLSAVIECADSAHGLKGHIISDGGCNCPGDVAKAFGAGADFVMIGGMFAGHDQSAGDIIERNGKKVKLFYGMSSDTAMKKHAGGVAEYRETRVVMSLPHAEKMTGTTGRTKRQWDKGIKGMKKGTCVPPLLPRSASLSESKSKGKVQNGKIGQQRLRFGSRPEDSSFFKTT
ncbi:GMP reductase 1 isoform X1 [Onychostruthus taczanowskii]|uniref:GMP reductase 1 isoform X1 n=1 Tax=Onychostruthus taczanowskii TaxID=356909 RepID=UPI001B802D7D|nr:GMP reductase 1 isoform X1 [Onychostruthus taczanowskii]